MKTAAITHKNGVNALEIDGHLIFSDIDLAFQNDDGSRDWENLVQYLRDANVTHIDDAWSVETEFEQWVKEQKSVLIVQGYHE